ncbi:MAG TPA: ELWxxDGT repeat protein [Archangium sp.]|uniref:ELWxxDGT repeat protein n=1 Tax=Archangium sp. TaxID=1872627 RepID=UPI002E332B72|nr:ELWxxDGT repeat protein [Archangium sp.]HEX5750261.1 ELWxxDGT repeat protein [Archangium sp.]
MRCWRPFAVLLALFSAPALAQAGEPLLDAGGWKPCGRAATPLAELAPGAGDSEPGRGVRGERVLFFASDDGVHGREPWVSTGTGGRGTSLLLDVRPGPEGAEPSGLTRVGERVFFVADDGEHGRELWVSDGSSRGTHLVKDIWPGPDGSYPQSLVELGGVLYFAAGDPEHGRELWRSDGTAEGTWLVEDLDPGFEGTSPYLLTRGGDGALYFISHFQGFYMRLMRSDGRSRAVELFRRSSEGGDLESLTAVGNKLFFVSTSVHDDVMAELRVTSGGAPVLVGSFPRIHDLVAMGGRLYFSASGEGDSTNEELWRSDGTRKGTLRVKDLRPGAEGSSPGGFAVLGRRLFFSADDGVNGRELWVSDGTASGTLLFADLVPGSGGSSPEALTAVDGNLFFSAETPGHGREPWVSSGSNGSAAPLDELAAGMDSSDPGGFVRSGWDVFFLGRDAAHGWRLWALPFRPAHACDDDAR